MTTEHKVFIGIGLATVIIMVGGIFLVSNTGPSSKPFMGQEVPISGRQHFPDGTKITYDTNPPAEGNHYPEPQDAGVYTISPADGRLVHSLEHGAVILWYKLDLPKADIEKLQKIYYETSGSKKIMTPRKSLDVPVALSSWGRVLKLQIIDEKQILDFFETNLGRGLENAPI